METQIRIQVGIEILQLYQINDSALASNAEQLCAHFFLLIIPLRPGASGRGTQERLVA